MKTALIKSILGFSLLGAAFGSPLAAQKSPSNLSTSPGKATPLERVDLGESTRMAGEVTRFLQQPKLAETVALAKSDKASSEEAARNPGAFLAKHGVAVPQNIQVGFQPSGGQGAGLTIRVEIVIRCCPPSAKITISW